MRKYLLPIAAAAAFCSLGAHAQDGQFSIRCWTYPDRQSIIFTEVFNVSQKELDHIDREWVRNVKHHYSNDVLPNAFCGTDGDFRRATPNRKMLKSTWVVGNPSDLGRRLSAVRSTSFRPPLLCLASSLKG